MITRIKSITKNKQTPFIYSGRKEFKEKNINENKKKEGKMAKRVKIRGKYYEKRERSTSAGRKGTIKGKWKPKNKDFWERLTRW